MASADFKPRLSFSSLSSSSLSSSSSSAFIPLHKTQLHPRMLHPPSLSSSPNPPKSNPNSRHPHKHLLLIISLSLLPFSLYLLSLYRSLHIPSPSTFGLVIEIADSKSQIRVFKSLNEVSGTPFSGESSDLFRVESGSGSDPGIVGRVVEKLVRFAKEKIPDSEWKATRVQAMVRGGKDGVESVLEECRRVLRSSGFVFRDAWASVLQGEDEGLYNWVATNYALGYIGKKPQETAGVIVPGSSAMQVSFASDEPSKSSRVIKLAGVTYNLYTQSLQQFGQDAIWKLLHKQNSQELRSLAENSEGILRSACLPRGYELTPLSSDESLGKAPASGNFSSCKSEVLALLNSTQGKCANPPCDLAPSILIELETKPHPQQKFFLASELKGLVTKASVPELEAIGHHFCEDNWDNLKKQHNVDDMYLARSCFSHAFMSILLHESFGIPLDDKRIGFAAGSTPVDWRLGAFIAQTLMEPLENQVEERVETHVIGNESISISISISYFVLFAILLVLVLLAAYFVMKLRKPQFKTVYDLEKGCYIVTRVPR